MDPTLLPEPNHVVLNHTFTLSIRVSRSLYEQCLIVFCSYLTLLNITMLVTGVAQSSVEHSVGTRHMCSF